MLLPLLVAAAARAPAERAAEPRQPARGALLPEVPTHTLGDGLVVPRFETSQVLR